MYSVLRIALNVFVPGNWTMGGRFLHFLLFGPVGVVPAAVVIISSESLIFYRWLRLSGWRAFGTALLANALSVLAAGTAFVTFVRPNSPEPAPIPLALGIGFGVQLAVIALANMDYRSQTRLLTAGAVAIVASFLLAVLVEWGLMLVLGWG